MIARVWRGAVAAEDGDAYAAYLEKTGVADYRATPGNRGVQVLRRDVDDQTEFVLVTLWDSTEAIRAFAGDDIEAAVYYDEDDRYLLDREPRVVAPPDAAPLPHGGGRVELREVTFAYDGGEPVLRDVNLEVAPGRTVALVGPTGSGKSTLVMLIPRLYDVSEGSVRVDGVDIRSLDPASLRRQVAVVSHQS